MKFFYENILQIALISFLISFITRSYVLFSNSFFMLTVILLLIKTVINIKYWFDPYNIRELSYISTLINGDLIKHEYKELLEQHLSNINLYFIPYIKSLKFLENSDFDKNIIKKNMLEKLTMLKKSFRNTNNQNIKNFFIIFNEIIIDTNNKIENSIDIVLNENNLYIRKKRFKELFIECFTDFLSDFSEAMEKYENIKRSENITLLTEKKYQERFNILAEANNYLQKKL